MIGYIVFLRSFGYLPKLYSPLPGAVVTLTSCLKTFSDSLSKLSPQEGSTNDIIARQRLLCDVKNDPEHALWQLQER